MKLIRVADTGIQHQFSLPSLSADGFAKIDMSEEDMRKQERINKMLIAQGRTPERVTKDFINHIEPNYIYATISGYEYIKMDLKEFWWFMNIINALANIDADELGFYGINLFVCKESLSINKSVDLVQFEYAGHEGNISGMCDAIMLGDLNEKNYDSFFTEIRLLG